MIQKPPSRRMLFAVATCALVAYAALSIWGIVHLFTGRASPDDVAGAVRHEHALLLLYEGLDERAQSALRRARSLVEANRAALGGKLSGLIWLQAVASLRKGETDNCVSEHCAASCIFPIAPAGVHRKPQASRRAVQFLREYLKLEPDSQSARWVMNVACMTLGEYPDRVPPEYRLAPSMMKSEQDIGRFVDVAGRLGLDRLDCSGGAIMDDLDGDGLLDLVESTWSPSEHMVFFRNRGDGTFEDRSKASGLDRVLGGFYVVQTDYNNDGRLDLFLSRTGLNSAPIRNSLLRQNVDGTFTDVTRAAGLPYWGVASLTASWADYDNDGWLDVYVCVENSRSRLYRNKGNGTFEEVAFQAGVDNLQRSAKGAAWGDYDLDRYADLYVSNHPGPPRLFHNNRNGTFTDVAPGMGIVRPGKGFSCWMFDYDNDGWLDIFAAAFEADLEQAARSLCGQPYELDRMKLYRNRGGRGFDDVTAQVGLDQAPIIMGSNYFDADNDGFLDLYLGTGSPPYSFLVPNRMFRNDGARRFVDITASSGTGHLQKGHAVACGDWDRDGNVDVFQQMGGVTPADRYRNVLYHNPGHDNHWITVKLKGTQTNRPGIGARIKVTVADGEVTRSIYRHVNSGSSFGANCLEQTIGIGKAPRVGALEVYWPTSDTTQVFRDVARDQAVEIAEGASGYRRLERPRVPFVR